MQKSRYKVTEFFDAEANDVLIEITGRLFINSLPGDQGPFGVVGEPGLLLSVVGHQEFTVDLETFFITSYSVNGQTTDLCALLSD